MQRNPNLYYTVALLSLLVLLTGCQTTGPGRTIKPQPICDALLGPIKYNSKNPKSLRFAGQTLVLDLKARNYIGQRLNCPGYR